ncbi:MAG: hypothetical protein EA391_06945 [Balneolaceae bacterium]|nr:MAG: hypothetical protein EA391_06945 [Balneolaceae bacterium]
MDNINYKFYKPFIVRSYEVGENSSITMPVLCDYFQEAAGLHAHELQFDIKELHKKGLTWVLYKMTVEVIGYPKRWEKVTVQTWPSVGDGFKAFRDYKLVDENKNTLALGVSQWIVLDIKKRRAVKLPESISDFGQQVDSHVLKPVGNLNPPADSKQVFITKVSSYDLDMNNHPNNVAYIKWLTGYIDDESISNKICYNFQIQYIAEAAKNDNIYLNYSIEISGDEQIIHHSITNSKDGKVLAIARSLWK